MFPLLRYFSLMSGAVIGVATILIALGFYNHEINRVVELGEEQNTRVARLLANAVEKEIAETVKLPADAERDRASLVARPEARELHETLRSIVQGIPVLKVKLYTLDGLTVYSSQSSQIGADKSESAGLGVAATEGKPTSKLSHRMEFVSYSGILLHRDVVETYIPVYFSDQTIGAVFELYSDVTAEIDEVKHESMLAIGLLLAVFALVYGGMFFIVRRADATLRRQYARIGQNEEAARQQNQTLAEEIGQRQEAQAKLQDAHDTMEAQVEKRTRDLRLLSMAVEQSPASVLVTSVDAVIEYVNPQFIETTGYTADELIGNRTDMLRSEATSIDVYREMTKTLEAGNQWRGELLNQKKSGEKFWESVSISPITAESEETTHYVAVAEDITLRRDYEDQLLKQANYDDLTGLANRLLVRDRMSEAVKEADRIEKQLAVLLIDLDDFKKINDTLGHAAGDELLCDVSHRIRNCIRTTDTLGRNVEAAGAETIGRLGGDEFVILLPHLSDLTQSERVAEAVLESLELPFEISGHELFISASIGIAGYPGDGGDVDELLSCADMAMYQAKDDGRGRFRYFTNALNENAMERLQIEHELRHSLERQEFTMNYQPIVSAQDGSLIGAEALLRWNNEKLGQVSPELFIPVAESTGLIIPIGEWILDTTMAAAASFCANLEHDFYVTVNVSGRQLRETGLLESFQEGFDQHHLPVNAIKAEITESMILDEYGETERNLAGLGELGVRLVIDDFGTGFSSLRNLTRVPTETVKIDKSFVLGALENREDADMVHAVIAMAHGLNIRVVAEGVETQEHLDYLKSVNCDLIQGWHTGRPATFEDFMANFILTDRPLRRQG